MMEAGLQGGNRLAPAKQEAKPPKGICYQWSKGGSCTKGEDCPYSHPPAQRGRSPERTAGGTQEEGKGREEVVEALALEVTRSLLRRPRRFPAQEESPLPEC